MSSELQVLLYQNTIKAQRHQQFSINSSTRSNVPTTIITLFIRTAPSPEVHFFSRGNTGNTRPHLPANQLRGAAECRTARIREMIDVYKNKDIVRGKK